MNALIAVIYLNSLLSFGMTQISWTPIYVDGNSQVDLWTHEANGCRCSFDSRRQDCACCVKDGGCPCGRESPNRCTQCGLEEHCSNLCNVTLDSRVLSARSGKTFGQIKSPSIQGPTSCYYTLIPGTGQRVEVQIYRLISVGRFNGTGCQGGFLQLVDGSATRTNKDSAEICGVNDRYAPPVLLFADNGPATLILNITEPTVRSQFLAYFSFTSMASNQGIHSTGGRALENTECDWLYQDFTCRTSGSCILTSPGFPGLYPPNILCKYHIAISSIQTRVKISFASLLLPQKYIQSDEPDVRNNFTGLQIEPCLNQFYSLLENNHIANATLSYRTLTVFAPTNQAFQNFKPTAAKDSLVSYHMATLPLKLDQMYTGQQVPTDYDGNPPLWLTRTHRNEIYVNNARILPKSNHEAYNQNGKKQVLHIISEVLEPVVSTNPGVPLYNPDAYQFLNQSENIGLGKHRVRSFRQRIMITNKEQIFKDDGRFTFFIPVDEGFTNRMKRESYGLPPQFGGSVFFNVSYRSFAAKPPPRPEKIDGKVIDGHVIPDYVLFTGPTIQGKEYKTLAFGDMIKVTISLTQQNDGKHSKIYVKSNTVVGDDNHPTGVVLAEIVRANIPVKNGVVHLIHRPLMVVDSTVEQFLKEKIDGPLYRFHKIIIDAGGDFMERINQRGQGITLFAPSNAAWNESYLEGVLEDRPKLREILDLHLVETKLPMETIIHNNANEIFQVPTSGGRQNLYFNVVQGPHNNLTLTVEGGGVNATVIQPDIAALNGVVHIIDRVLGVPFTTVRDKLATDPMLNDTFFLGERTGFNGQLKNLNHKFTYFVPRDLAWKKAKLSYPSAHKKLFMRQYDYHVRQILERHLVIHDRVYTMAELKQMHNDTFTLPTIRDSLRIKIKEIDITEDDPDYFNYDVFGSHGINTASSLPGPRKGYAIDWRGETIPVFRPDVYCTNGIIHVIDKVLLQDSDVRVNSADIAKTNTLSLCMGLIILIKISLN